MALVRAERASRPAIAAPWLDRALRLADSALARDPRHAPALALRGTATYQRVLSGLVPDTAEVTRTVAAAERDLRAAVDRDPTLATAWVRLSELSYRQLNIIQANRDAQRAYEADAYLAAAPRVLWRLFATSYDLEQPVEARRWCAEGAARFPAEPNFLRCQIVLMTMRGETPDVSLAWRLTDSLRARWPEPVRPFQERFDRVLVAVALARANLPDSARHVLLAARADSTVDPRGELRGLEAFARTTLGDRDEALSLLEGYLHDYPEHRSGFARLNSWWWQGINREPRFIRLVSGG
jgi:tetratricopeptide (TPR) repeat protein